MYNFIKFFEKLIFNLVTLLITCFVGFWILEFGVENGWIKSSIEENQVFVEITWFIIIGMIVFFILRYLFKKLLPVIIFYGLFIPILWIGCKFFNWPIPPTYRKNGSVDYHNDNK